MTLNAGYEDATIGMRHYVFGILAAQIAHGIGSPGAPVSTTSATPKAAK